MTALYTHTTRASGTILTASIYNADHQNHITYGDAQYLGGWSNSVAQMQIQTDPGEQGSESLGSSISDELEHLRFAIKETKQKIDSTITYWYETPNAKDNSGDAPYPPMFIERLRINGDSVGTPGMVLVGQGSCRSMDNMINLKVTASIFKSVTGLWLSQVATGTAGCGVTMSPKQQFNVFVFKTAASTVDVGFDTVLTASNLMARASATHYRRIGTMFMATAAGNFVGVHQTGEYLGYRAPLAATFFTQVSSAGAGQIKKIAHVPTGFSVEARIRLWATAGAVGRIQMYSWPQLPPSVTSNEQYYSAVSTNARIEDVWTSPCGDVVFVDTGATGARWIASVDGWMDPRTE